MCPVEPSKEVRLGNTVPLEVYVAGDPPISRTEILWTRGDGTAIITNTRVSLTDSHKRLLIRNVRLEDSGMYHIDIRRQITALIFRNLATAVIDLDVHGKCVGLLKVCQHGAFLLDSWKTSDRAHQTWGGG